MREISTAVPKRAAARKFPHSISPEEVAAIGSAVAKMPGGYVVSEGQTRRALVIVATPTVAAANQDIEAGNLDDDFPTISFRRLPTAEFYKSPQVTMSVWWPGDGSPSDLPLLRSLEGALSILPALAAQWVRT